LHKTANHRSQPRSNVFLDAVLVVGSAAHPVRLRNLSSRGALIEGASLPTEGSRVRVLRGELSAEGDIAWQEQGLAGLRFASEIDVERWVRRVGHRGQQRVDEAIAALRGHQNLRRGANGAMQPSIAEISIELDRICERLADAPPTGLAIAEELPKLNRLARQLQRLSGRE
jgi:hypothetical protein